MLFEVMFNASPYCMESGSTSIMPEVTRANSAGTAFKLAGATIVEIWCFTYSSAVHVLLSVSTYIERTKACH
jgi:hypothetical protein